MWKMLNLRLYIVLKSDSVFFMWIFNKNIRFVWREVLLTYIVMSSFILVIFNFSSFDPSDPDKYNNCTDK